MDRIVKPYLLDTNILLYWLGDRLQNPLAQGYYFTSIISEIELLSYHGIDAQAENQIRSLLNSIEVVELDQTIKELTISLRKIYRLKLPDSIVVATASSLGATLLTNDIALARIRTIEIQSLPLRE
jgi:predicted nucleic acid-binding protein